MALKEITYHNTLLSVVNETIEVWEDFPGKIKLDTLELKGQKITSTDPTNFLFTPLLSSRFLAGRVSTDGVHCQIEFRKEEARFLMERFENNEFTVAFESGQ
jgi:hypothetical protein